VLRSYLSPELSHDTTHAGIDPSHLLTHLLTRVPRSATYAKLVLSYILSSWGWARMVVRLVVVWLVMLKNGRHIVALPRP
jgi:hypothetical protein